MIDKPLSDKRQHFVREYCSNGHNASKAYHKAYPGCKAGWDKLAVRMMGYDVIKAAIVIQEAINEAEDENSRVFVTNKMMTMLTTCEAANDRTNAVRVLEDLGKNVGWFAEDNAQQREKAELTEQEKEEAIEYAQWRLMKDNVPKAKEA